MKRMTYSRRSIGGSSEARKYISSLKRTESWNMPNVTNWSENNDEQSDMSLEDDIHGLNSRLQTLDEKMAAITENQCNGQERYDQLKQENGSLHARLSLMEDQLRETEARMESALESEKRRCAELVARIEREKILELENMQLRINGMEKDIVYYKRDIDRVQTQFHQSQTEKDGQTKRLSELEVERAKLLDQSKSLIDRESQLCRTHEHDMDQSNERIEKLRQELESLRNELFIYKKNETSDIRRMKLQHSHMEEEIAHLYLQNKELKELNDELRDQILSQALRSNPESSHEIGNSGSYNLAYELSFCSDDVDGYSRESESVEELKTSVKEQKKVNEELKEYINRILTTIVEKNPQLLEKNDP